MPCTPAQELSFGFLLTEDGGFLLQEDGSKIIIATDRVDNEVGFEFEEDGDE